MFLDRLAIGVLAGLARTALMLRRTNKPPARAPERGASFTEEVEETSYLTDSEVIGPTSELLEAFNQDSRMGFEEPMR